MDSSLFWFLFFIMHIIWTAFILERSDHDEKKSIFAVTLLRLHLFESLRSVHRLVSGILFALEILIATRKGK